MASLEAVPTEYKGVVYRSKSEAMFARWIELSKKEGSKRVRSYVQSKIGGPPAFGWIYEPIGLCVDGWIPDFLSWHVCGFDPNPVSGFHSPYATCDIIEYKPSIPTKTYLRKFVRRCNLLCDVLGQTSGDSTTAYRYGFYLYYGSLWNADKGRFEFFPGNHKGDQIRHFPEDWQEPFLDEIKATRFDLEANNG